MGLTRSRIDKLENIVLISIDSLRQDVLGCYGNKSSRTPEIDALAENGTIFFSHIVQAPYTTTSHASILTGLYPFNHGIRKHYTKNTLRENSLYAMNKLKSRNLKLAVFSDTHFFDPSYGYNIWNWHDKTKILNIARYLKNNKGKGLFILIHYLNTHTPYDTSLSIETPKDLLSNIVWGILKNDYFHIPLIRKIHNFVGGDRYRINKIRKIVRSSNEDLIEKVKSGYDRAVEKADKFIGRILNILSEMALLNNTVIIITADHGESFNEFGEANDFEDYEHGHSLYDTVIRVPLIISGGEFRSGKTMTKQTQSIDIMPTILDLFGLYDKKEDRSLLDGISLVKSVCNTTFNGHQFAYSETRIRNENKAAIRTKDYKLIVDYHAGQEFLFDMKSHDESDNLLDLRPSVAANLRNQLKDFVHMHCRFQIESERQMDEDEYSKIKTRLKDLGYLE